MSNTVRGNESASINVHTDAATVVEATTLPNTTHYIVIGSYPVRVAVFLRDVATVDALTDALATVRADIVRRQEGEFEWQGPRNG